MDKVIIFDVDGTLVNGNHEYVWQLLHENFGTKNDAKAYTKLFFDGKITYNQWVFEHLRLISNNGKRKERHIREEIKKNTYILDETFETLEKIKGLEYKLAILSGGLNLSLEAHNLTEYFDIILTNFYFDSKPSKNGWEYKSTKFDLDNKKQGVQYISSQYNIPAHKCIFVGDNSNDLSAFGICEKSIALNPKTQDIQNIASKTIFTNSLKSILNFI